MGDTAIVLNWLSIEHNIKVPEDWVVECMAWIRTESPNITVTLDFIKEEVYTQWLHTDLRDFNTPVLPANISRQKKTTVVCTSFPLQVMKAWDISKPAYTQLMKLNNTVNDDVEVSATPKEEKEKIGNRMLQMELTDGVQTVKAIEYQPIPHINVQVLQPGCKVKLQGNVMVRNGILFLNYNNIKVLSGAVADLLETNGQKAVLEAQLYGLPTRQGQDQHNEALNDMDIEEDLVDINFDEEWSDIEM